MDTERRVNDEDWPPRPWDHDWARRHTTLPKHLQGVLDRDEPAPDPVTDPEPDDDGHLPLSSAGWAPGEYTALIRARHPEWWPPTASDHVRYYPPRDPGIVLPPAP